MNNFRRAAALAFAAVTLSACALPRIDMSDGFDVEEASYIKDEGDNTISGQAFLTKNGGGVVTCAGNNAELYPDTAYSRLIFVKMFQTLDGPSREIKPRSPLDVADGFTEYRRLAPCDAEGDFVFEKVADGDYFLGSDVFWFVGQYNIKQGGLMLTPVSVSGGEEKRVLLSPS